MELLENTLNQLRNHQLPILESILSPSQARLELQVLADLVIRCTLAKPWPNILGMPSLPGKGDFTELKLGELGTCWAKLLDTRHPGQHLAARTGFLAVEDQASVDPKDNLDLSSLPGAVAAEPQGDQAADPSPGFKRGDKVTVIRRMTPTFDLGEDKPPYRRNLDVGLEATVEGWADTKMERVVIKFKVTLADGEVLDLTHTCAWKNLQHTKDYQLFLKGQESKDKKEGEEGEGSKKEEDNSWFIGDSAPEDVRKEVSWTKEKLVRVPDPTVLAFLKARIQVGLESLDAMLKDMDQVTDEHLAIIHRRNDKGAWKTELWTKVDMEPYKLKFAPVSSQLKDTHLTTNANVLVGLPKHGRGAHPDQGQVALDGRGQLQVAKAGTLDDKEHLGALFWLVGKTDKRKEANMDLVPIHYKATLEYQLPWVKKRKTGENSWTWEPTELPSIPILVNKARIPKETRLLAFEKAK